MTVRPDATWVKAEAQRLAPLLEGATRRRDQRRRMPQAAAAVALELARLHGATRRVAIADLVGDAAPLREAVTGADDDPHGISDSFLYGVSLNRIARPIDTDGQRVPHAERHGARGAREVYRNDRWRRLAAGFEQVGALLLVVAVPRGRGLRRAVPVRRRPAAARRATPRPAFPTCARSACPPPPPPAETVRKTERAREVATEDRGQRQSQLLATLAAAAAVVLLGLAAWPTVQSRLFPVASIGAADAEPAPANGAADSTGVAEGGSAAGTIAVDAADQRTVGEAATGAPAGGAGATACPGAPSRTGPLVVANPADSAQAAATRCTS